MKFVTITLSFYILFLIPSFLIHPHKLFSMQLGPGITSLACARLIVPFAPFNVTHQCHFENPRAPD